MLIFPLIVQFVDRLLCGYLLKSQHKLEMSMRAGVSPAVVTIVYLTPSLVYGPEQMHSIITLNKRGTEQIDNFTRSEMRLLGLARRPFMTFTWLFSVEGWGRNQT